LVATECPTQRARPLVQGWYVCRISRGLCTDSAERLQVLAAIIRSPLAKVDRLQLATAEMSTSFDKPRSMILQECYSVATEEVRRRKGKGELINLYHHWQTLMSQLPRAISLSDFPLNLSTPAPLLLIQERSGPPRLEVTRRMSINLPPRPTWPTWLLKPTTFSQTSE
jgi:hypothetical protein